MKIKVKEIHDVAHIPQPGATAASPTRIDAAGRARSIFTAHLVPPLQSDHLTAVCTTGPSAPVLSDTTLLVDHSLLLNAAQVKRDLSAVGPAVWVLVISTGGHR